MSTTSDSSFRSGWITAGLALLAALAGCGGGGSSGPPPNPLYVDAGGSNMGTGDIAAPLRTINRALEIALDGYTIIVAPGTYREAVSTDRSGAAAIGITLLGDFTGELSGVPAGPVLIQPVAGDRVTGIKLNNSPGSIVDGFSVTGSSGGGIVVNRSNDARVQSCIVFENDGTQADGIRVQSSTGVLLFNNLIYRNRNRGISIVGDPGSPNVGVINNTVHENTFRGIAIGTTEAPSTGALVLNNVVTENGGRGETAFNIRILGTSTTGYMGNFSLVFPATYSPPTAAGTRDVAADPRYVDPADANAPDFRLRLASPAINAGTRDLPDPMLAECLQKWSAVEDDSADVGQVDMGYHVPLGAPEDAHCGVPLPVGEEGAP